MQTQTGTFLGRPRLTHTQVWQPCLVRAITPRWDDQDRAAVDQLLGAYQKTLKASPRGLATLDACGISREAIDAFELGFAVRGLGVDLPRGETHDGARLRGRLHRIGLYRSTGHAHLNGALVAPIRDARGRIVDLYGRKVAPKLRAGSAYHLSLFDPPQGVFNLAGLAKGAEVMICDDLLDALAFWSAGMKNVTSTVGSRGFTDGHLRAFAALEVTQAVIAFSMNPEQDRHARLIAQALDAQGVTCRRMCLPRDVLGGPSAGALQELVGHAPAFRQSAEHLLKEAA